MTHAYDLPPELRVEVDGPIRTVVMNRPDELNAVDEPLVDLHLTRAFAGPMQEGLAAEAASMETDDHRTRVLAMQPKAS